MLYEDAICKNDDVAIERLRTSGEGKEVMAEYKVRKSVFRERHASEMYRFLDLESETKISVQDLMDTLQEKSGKKMNDWVNVRDLLDTLTIEKNLNLKIPDWADSKTWEQMESYAKYTTLLNYKDADRLKFRIGLLLKDMSMHLDDAVNNANIQKLFIYASVRLASLKQSF